MNPWQTDWLTDWVTHPDLERLPPLKIQSFSNSWFQKALLFRKCCFCFRKFEFGMSGRVLSTQKLVFCNPDINFSTFRFSDMTVKLITKRWNFERTSKKCYYLWLQCIIFQVVLTRSTERSRKSFSISYKRGDIFFPFFRNKFFSDFRISKFCELEISQHLEDTKLVSNFGFSPLFYVI